MTNAEAEALQKKVFARELMRGATAYEAICKAIPDSSKDRVGLANIWKNDPEVIELIRAISSDETDEIHALPTKVDFLKQMWEKMRHSEGSDYAKLAKVFADVCGHTQKPKEGNSLNDNSTHNTVYVMGVQNYGTDEDWESAAMSQQRRLVQEGNRLVESTGSAAE